MTRLYTTNLGSKGVETQQIGKLLLAVCISVQYGPRSSIGLVGRFWVLLTWRAMSMRCACVSENQFQKHHVLYVMRPSIELKL